MAVSKLLPAGGANDFNLNVTGQTTVTLFDKEYSAGSYSITSSGNDQTTDIYAYNAAGTLVGYTSTKAFTASGSFNKVVVLGGTVGDVLGFNFKKTFVTNAATAEVTAGPVISSINQTAMPNINNTITVTGLNFASDVTVTFSGTGYSATAAKSIVRSSSTSLIVTRPDNLPPSGSPYTITVSNPGVPNPVGSNTHILPNAATAGGSPVWSTAATLPVYTRNVAYSQAVSATDTGDAGTSLTYSVVSSTLPAGISFNTSTAVFSGTATTSAVQGTATIRVTDTGGNFVDRAFSIANVGPVWTTAATLPGAVVNTSYSTTVAATDDGSIASYTIVSGSLPTGTTLNTSTGVISGTPTVYTGLASPNSFTLRATDNAGSTTDRSFTLAVLQAVFVTLTSSTNWTAPAGVTSIDYLVVAGGGSGAGPNPNVGASGGGAGGMRTVTGAAVTPGSNYAAVIGGGGSAFGGSGDAGFGVPGGNSSFLGTSCTGGGGGGSWQAGTLNGGSGGGASGNSGGTAGTGISGEGNNGGAGRNQEQWCGGGGKGSAGGLFSNGAGEAWVDGITYAQGGSGNNAGNSGGTNANASAPNRGWGGTGRVYNDSASYGSAGVVKIRYLG